jgi:hypothetical protein
MAPDHPGPGEAAGTLRQVAPVCVHARPLAVFGALGAGPDGRWYDRGHRSWRAA